MKASPHARRSSLARRPRCRARARPPSNSSAPAAARRAPSLRPQLDRPAKQQQFLGKCRLPGVRLRNGRKRPPAQNLVGRGTHRSVSIILGGALFRRSDPALTREDITAARLFPTQVLDRECLSKNQEEAPDNAPPHVHRMDSYRGKGYDARLGCLRTRTPRRLHASQCWGRGTPSNSLLLHGLPDRTAR